ncbi:25_t:CDS:10 [Entrophospora sp. SA101]|nr:25_t:CDS:10 [Entrophospora sp. SA101]
MVKLLVRDRREKSFTEFVESYNSLVKKLGKFADRNAELEISQSSAIEHHVILSQELEKLKRFGSEATIKRNIELEEEVRKLREERDESYKTQGQNAQKLLDLTDVLNQHIELNKKNQEEILRLTDSNTNLNKKVDLSVQVIREKEVNIQILQDELAALQLELSKLEEKMHDLKNENHQLLQQVHAKTLGHQNGVVLVNEDNNSSDNDNNNNNLVNPETNNHDSNRNSINDNNNDSLKVILNSEKQNHNNHNHKINQKISSPPTVVDLNITAHDGEIHTIASTVDGSMFATGSADKTINVFDTETGNVKQTLTGPHQSIMHVSFNNTNEAIVCASSDNVARVWSLNTGRIAFTLTSHLGKVYSARFNCDSTRVITGSHDRTIKVWDIQRGYCSRTIYAYSSCNDVVSLDDYGTTLASGHLDNSLRFWDVKSGKDIKELTNIHLGQITSVCLSPDRTKVLTNSRDNSLKLIDLRTYQIEQTLKADGYKTGANWARLGLPNLPRLKLSVAVLGDVHDCDPGKFSTPVTYNDDDLNAKADVKMSGYEFAANIMLSVNFLVSLIKKNWQNVKRFLCGLGDTIAQHVVEKRGIKNHDSYRTIRIGGFGLLIAGPVPAVWYRILDRYVKFENPITGLLARVALDQMVFAPTFIAGFFLIQGILEGKTKLQLTRKLEKAYLPALLNSYKIWPIVQLINFRFVPLDHRLLVVNTVALGWNTYLSVTNNKVQ